jgi:hypothetical protein
MNRNIAIAPNTAILKKTDTTKDRLECFRQFILERERVRIAKAAGDSKPWTNDKILQTYHFCNVRRADDRVTKWIGKWAKNWKDQDRWFAYAVARWFNEPDTLSLLPTTFDRVRYRAVLEVMLSNKQKMFRASYIINGYPGMPKYLSVLNKVLWPLWEAGPVAVDYSSMQGSHSKLMAFDGMGSFMAGQIVADWQTFGTILGLDRNRWAPIGPGSAKGIQWVFGLDKLPKQDEAVELMIQARDWLDQRNPKVIDRLILHDVQNCFCEMSKYVRGFSKTKYRPYEDQQAKLF